MFLASFPSILSFNFFSIYLLSILADVLSFALSSLISEKNFIDDLIFKDYLFFLCRTTPQIRDHSLKNWSATPITEIGVKN